MKVLHVADVHLGMIPEKDKPWSELRTREIQETFEHILQVCEDEKVDLLLIAGDLFHRQPLVRELREVDYQFQKLSQTKVVLIAGNHDYIGIRSNYADFVWASNVTMLKEQELAHVTFPELRTTVYGFSYHSRDISEPLYDVVSPQGEGISILLAHGGDRKDIPMDYKRIDLAGFHYVAMGHIHKAHKFSDTMFYSGSPEPLDKNETGEHGYVMVDMTLDLAGRVNTEATFVPCAKREYIDMRLQVNGKDTNGSIIDRLRHEIVVSGEQNLYRVWLEGDRAEQLELDLAAISAAGKITEVIDETLPEFDFEAIQKANADNLVGMYINKLQSLEDPDGTVKKALYYGLKALLR